MTDLAEPASSDFEKCPERAEGVLCIMAYSKWLRPKRVPFHASGIRKGRDFAVRVQGRVGKSVISVGKKTNSGYKMRFMASKKSGKRSGFVICS